MLLLLIFFGAITYAITGSIVWALIIGSLGWAIIAYGVIFIGFLIDEVVRDIKRKRKRRNRVRG